MDDEIRIARIYISEADHGHRTTLMREILNILHDQQHVKGVVVFRGIAGFGDSGEVHASDILRINVDLPVVIEFFDSSPIVLAVLGVLEKLVPSGHMLHWAVTRHGGAPVRSPGARSIPA